MSLPPDQASASNASESVSQVALAARKAADPLWTSLVSSAVVHVSVAAALVGWVWATQGRWLLVPPSPGVSSVASQPARVIEVAAPSDDEAEDSEPIELATGTPQPAEIAPEVTSPRKELLVASAAYAALPSVAAEDLIARAPQAEPQLQPRVGASATIETTEPPRKLSRQPRQRAVTTLASTAAEVDAPAASQASAASTASTGAQSRLPTVVFNPAPIYPESLAAARISGLVKLHVELNAAGRVTKASVSRSSGYAAFDRAALDVIHRWRFTASGNSDPTQRALIVPIRFGIVD